MPPTLSGLSLQRAIAEFSPAVIYTPVSWKQASSLKKDKLLVVGFVQTSTTCGYKTRVVTGGFSRVLTCYVYELDGILKWGQFMLSFSNYFTSLFCMSRMRHWHLKSASKYYALFYQNLLLWDSLLQNQNRKKPRLRCCLSIMGCHEMSYLYAMKPLSFHYLCRRFKNHIYIVIEKLP